MKPNPLIPPLQSDVGPTIDDLGNRTIDQLKGSVSAIAVGAHTVVTMKGVPHLVIEAILPSGTIRVGLPVTLELIAFLRAALQGKP